MAARTARSRRFPSAGAGQGRPRLFGPDPGRLDELVVLHAGRAGGHARHAAQAAVEVLGRRRGQPGAVQDLAHQVDPAARGVHLLGPQLVGGTGRQAEPAVHAVVGHLAQPVGVLHHCPQGNRPGHIRWPGSNWSLTARIKSSPGTGWPAPAAARTAVGAASTATLPRTSPEPSADPANTPASRSRSARTNRRGHLVRDARIQPGVQHARAGRAADRGPDARARPGRGQRVQHLGELTHPERDPDHRSWRTRFRLPPAERRLGGGHDRVAPAPASSSAICLARSATPDGVPSSRTPTRSTAGGSVHSSSTADGTSAEPAADATAEAAPARAEGAKSPVTQATAAGSGCSRNVTSVMRPSVPCEPENSLPRS